MRWAWCFAGKLPARRSGGRRIEDISDDERIERRAPRLACERGKNSDAHDERGAPLAPPSASLCYVFMRAHRFTMHPTKPEGAGTVGAPVLSVVCHGRRNRAIEIERRRKQRKGGGGLPRRARLEIFVPSAAEPPPPPGCIILRGVNRWCDRHQSAFGIWLVWRPLIGLAVRAHGAGTPVGMGSRGGAKKRATTLPLQLLAAEASIQVDPGRIRVTDRLTPIPRLHPQGPHWRRGFEWSPRTELVSSRRPNDPRGACIRSFAGSRTRSGHGGAHTNPGESVPDVQM